MDALLRIFYATKYVTKMQEPIDSITAVAVAAFRHRQLREAREEEAVVNADRATIGRRRVASLLNAITNWREIAGLLAALYVQRGSCAFMSTPCATFHLRAILHELIDLDAHSRDLVELRGCDASVTFRAASFLDDYSYRPPGLDYLNLYEYVARQFRRKRTPTTSECVLFQREHPLFETHCVGNRIDEVVMSMRMPLVNDESPHELGVKRSQCALVLFKPFRAASDLVVDLTNDTQWIDAFKQWEPTRSGFTREIMANLDDYCRAAMQDQECTREVVGALQYLVAAS